MSYVKQICGGYNKSSLMGNWMEERLYPQQPFREQQKKVARQGDSEVACYDDKGSKRALPRIQRRNKWETNGRIVLNDGFNLPKSTFKGSITYQQVQTASKNAQKPFDRNFSCIHSTELHPNSQSRANHKQFRMLNHTTIDELSKNRSIEIQKESYKQQLPIQKKYKNDYMSTYQQTLSLIKKKQQRQQSSLSDTKAGAFNENPEEAVKVSTNMVGEFKKEQADQKEKTGIQRSWVPPKDKSLTYAVGKSPQETKKAKVPHDDIQTSLNIGYGLHNIHPKNVPNSYFKHIRQEITLKGNNSFCAR